MTEQAEALAEGRPSFLTRWSRAIRWASIALTVACIAALMRLLPVSALTAQMAGWAETGRGPGEWILLIAGLLVAIAVTVYVSLLAHRALQKQWVQAEAIEQAAQQRPARLAATLLSAALAASAIALTVLAYANPSLITGLFGPPAVTLSEAYSPKPQGPSFDHSAYEGILKQHVNPRGGVDYAGLLRQREKLSGYIRSIGQAPFDEMGRDEKLALLINAYNAFTLELILEHWQGGQLRSIREIPSDLRWDDGRWQIGGHTWSLNQIEHQQIRPKFRQPLVHWALVCAAIGCPPLRSEAYLAQRLESQLEGQARYVHEHPRWFRWAPDRGLVYLTQIYQWYGGDFEQVDGSVLQHASRFAPQLKSALQAERTPRIQWLEYDWRLNSQENIP